MHGMARGAGWLGGLKPPPQNTEIKIYVEIDIACILQ